MKQAVILHGTDANPGANWFPWLKRKFEAAGYEVWVPGLPGNHTPDREVYNEFLLNSGCDFEDSVIVGHSSGAVSILNLLMEERGPRIKLGVMVSAWDHGTPKGMEESQFVKLFPPNGFNFDLIRSKARTLAFLHANDDPYCPVKQADYLAKNLQAEITHMSSGGHLGEAFPELPEVWQVIDKALKV